MGVFTKKRFHTETEETKDKMLSALFEFQRFAEEPELSALIQETEKRFGTALSDEDMAEVSAAGEVLYKRPPKCFEE